MERVAIGCEALPVDWKRLGKRIREVWRASEVPQGTIVEKLSIKRQTMGSWMRGSRKPTTRNLERLADVIGAELVIDFVHPNEGSSVVVASTDGAEAAQRVDALDDLQRRRTMRFLRLAPDFTAGDWRGLESLMNGLEVELAEQAIESDEDPSRQVR